MRKSMLLAALCAVVVLAFAPAAGATSYAVAVDLCADYPTQEEAQSTLDNPAYGTGETPDLPGGATDPIGLDPDGDGVACNDPGNLVGGGSPEEPVCELPEGCEAQYEDGADLDCLDFASREEAQAVLDADGSDPSDLDADGDGLACEETFTPPPTQAEVPTGSGGCDEVVAQMGARIACEPIREEPSTQDEPRAPAELPATGGPDLPLPAMIGAALLLTGLGARRASR